MYQLGFFAVEEIHARLDKAGDPLLALKEAVPWEEMLPILAPMTFEQSAQGGRPPWDPLVMVRCLILQEYYQLSDEQLEYQINDRASFKRFIGIGACDKAPDAKTIWLYRERCKASNLAQAIFFWFQSQLEQMGCIAQKGQIVDATFVPTHKPTGKTKKQEKSGQPLSPHQKSQIDRDATFTRKGTQRHHGYKNHIQIDVKYKVIRDFEVTTASTHDSQPLANLITETGNTGRDVFGDSAYRSAEAEQMVRQKKLNYKVHYRNWKNKPMTEAQKRTNTTRSRIRARVEHTFGHMNNSMGGLLIHTIGLARAKVKVTFKNLAYNIHRLTLFQKSQGKYA
jgi:IS5 family transposase